MSFREYLRTTRAGLGLLGTVRQAALQGEFARQAFEASSLLLDAFSRQATSPLSVNSTAQDLGYSKIAFYLRLRRMIASHARTNNDREVDLAPVAVPADGGAAFTVPIESNWVDCGWKSEARTITGKYGCGIIATKTVLDLSGEVWAVPAPMLALALL
jgi:hypothetical protein